MYSVVGSDGQVYGPVDMQTLGAWIAEGRVTPETQLVDPIDGRTLLAGDAPALIGNFPKFSPTPPPSPGYAGPPPTNPYAAQPYGAYPRGGMAPYYGPPKSKVAALLLSIFFGSLGVHRFYIGHVSTGIAMVALLLGGFVTCGFSWIALGIWHLVDIVLIATGALREPNGRELV